MFHTAMVLLLEVAASDGSDLHSTTSHEIYRHARLACGVIKTNPQTCCLVNSLQPAYICGRHMRTRSEKFAVLEIFGLIHSQTGWKTEWRTSELRKLWGIA
nr:uncharacterized protein CTRU02_09754 [Colletotrichum truncatum]KAF6787941.1 hypothetical protein CTRU02_09754 [Colletotrichum truncatum]